MAQPEPRDVVSLQNWVEGTGCLASDETEYLSHSEELITLAATSDNASRQLEAWVESRLFAYFPWFCKVSPRLLWVGGNPPLKNLITNCESKELPF